MPKRKSASTIAQPESRVTIGSAAPAETTPRILSLDEIADLYPGETILLRVTAWDEDKIPSHGEVAGHWPPGKKSDRLVSKAFSNALREARRTHDHYFLFQAAHYIRSGEEMRKALEELSRSEELPRGRWW